MFKNITGGGPEVGDKDKEVFKDLREMIIVARDLLDDPKTLNDEVEKALEKSLSKWPSSQLKIDVLEAVSGKTCSLSYFQKAEKHLSEFSGTVNDLVEVWHRNNPRWKRRKERIKEQKENQVGYNGVKPFDPNKKYSWKSHAEHTSKD